MRPPLELHAETGSKRVFVDALEWPGWCRSGRTEEAAVAALLSYRERYAAVLRAAGLPSPEEPEEVEVIVRTPGTSVTDFGAPDVVAATDARPLAGAELDGQIALLDACWSAFDAAAAAAAGKTLTTGPRGGGRGLEAIVAHVHEALRADLSRFGARPPKLDAADPGDRARLRAAAAEALRARADGKPPVPGRSTKPPTPPRHLVRRTAWHILDHTWEIEDRAGLSA